MFARRFGGAGVRRGVRSPRGPREEVFPWTGFEANLYAAYDAYLGVATETGVSQWSDQSGTGNHLTQSTTSKQPAYTTLSGRPALQFTPASTHVLDDSAATGHAAGEDITMFIVGKSETTTTRHTYVELKSDKWWVNMSRAPNFATINVKDSVGSAHLVDWNAYDTAAHVVEFTHRDDRTEMFVDGTSRGSDTSPTITVQAQDAITIGARTGGHSHPMDGYIQSLLIFNTELSSGDRSTIRSRLGLRWGITVS